MLSIFNGFDGQAGSYSAQKRDSCRWLRARIGAVVGSIVKQFMRF